ncbi:hypothetical protein B0H13DRAFT_1926510 [Mycena leptocephala]|nr:hypothetical protein B0H13DRAFT_1926510 [Mycena leptocephala]
MITRGTVGRPVDRAVPSEVWKYKKRPLPSRQRVEALVRDRIAEKQRKVVFKATNMRNRQKKNEMVGGSLARRLRRASEWGTELPSGKTNGGQTTLHRSLPALTAGGSTRLRAYASWWSPYHILCWPEARYKGQPGTGRTMVQWGQRLGEWRRFEKGSDGERDILHDKRFVVKGKNCRMGSRNNCPLRKRSREWPPLTALRK